MQVIATIAILPRTMPAMAPEERLAEFEDGLGDIFGIPVSDVVSEGYPSPGLNMSVEFSA